jgi:hypothetical protein
MILTEGCSFWDQRNTKETLSKCESFKIIFLSQEGDQTIQELHRRLGIVLLSSIRTHLGSNFFCGHRTHSQRLAYYLKVL